MERFGPYVSVDYYQLPESGKSYRLSFPEYSKFVSAEFETKEELIKNKEVSDLVCIKCRRMLRKRSVGFLTDSGFILLWEFARSMDI